jgi:hypothetical protein
MKNRQFLQSIATRRTLVETYPPSEEGGDEITFEYLYDRVSILDLLIEEARELLEEGDNG